MTSVRCPHCRGHLKVAATVVAVPERAIGARRRVKMDPDVARRVLLAQLTVARHFEMTLNAVLGPSRSIEVNHVRRVAMYVARAVSGASYPQLGELFRRHHTTIMPGVRAIEARMRSDEALADFVGSLVSRLGNARLSAQAAE